MPTPNQLTTTDRFLANVPFSWGQVLLPMSPHPLDSSCSACAFPSALVVYSGGGRPKVGESNLAEPQASKQPSELLRKEINTVIGEIFEHNRLRS